MHIYKVIEHFEHFLQPRWRTL